MNRFAAVALLCSIALPAQATQTLYERYAQATGLWAQLAEMEDYLRAGIEEAVPAPTARRDAVLQRVGESYQPQRLGQDCAAELARTLPAADARVLLDWYDSPLGERFSRAQGEAAEQAAQLDQPAKVEAVLTALPSARKSLLQRLRTAIGGTGAVSTLLLNQHLALTRGVALAKGQQRLPPLATSKARLESQRTQLAQALEPALLASLAVTYQPFTDAELRQYVAVLESPAGRRAVGATRVAIDRTLETAAENLGRGWVPAAGSAP